VPTRRRRRSTIRCAPHGRLRGQVGGQRWTRPRLRRVVAAFRGGSRGRRGAWRNAGAPARRTMSRRTHPFANRSDLVFGLRGCDLTPIRDDGRGDSPSRACQYGCRGCRRRQARQQSSGSGRGGWNSSAPGARIHGETCVDEFEGPVEQLTKSAEGSSRAGSTAAISAPMKAPTPTRTRKSSAGRPVRTATSPAIIERCAYQVVDHGQPQLGNRHRRAGLAAASRTAPRG
jgi:hypothetical protein